MNRVNFKNINTKSVDQSYFKPKVNVKIKEKSTNTTYSDWWDYDKYHNNEHPENLGKGLFGQIREQKEYTTIKISEEIKPDFEFTKVDKVEKSKDKIIRTLIANNQRSYEDKGYYGWHSHYKYVLNGCTIKISDNVGGCGVQQLYNWGSVASNSNIPKLLKYILNDLHSGVSIVLCQVGNNYYNTLFCKTLEELGFKYYEQYKNHQHGGKDTGRIYSLIINKK